MIIFRIALKILLQRKRNLPLLDFRRDRHILFSLFLCLPFPSLAVSLWSASTCLSLQNIFKALFHQGYEREGRGDKKNKEKESAEEMPLRKQGTALKRMRWSARTLICILFVGPPSRLGRVDELICFCLPAGLCLTSLLYASVSFLKLLMRYVRRSTFSLCPGNVPQLERRSTTSVQLMPLVSDACWICRPSNQYLKPSRKTEKICTILASIKLYTIQHLKRNPRIRLIIVFSPK